MENVKLFILLECTTEKDIHTFCNIFDFWIFWPHIYPIKLQIFLGCGCNV